MVAVLSSMFSEDLSEVEDFSFFVPPCDPIDTLLFSLFFFFFFPPSDPIEAEDFSFLDKVDFSFPLFLDALLFSLFGAIPTTGASPPALISSRAVPSSALGVEEREAGVGEAVMGSKGCV